jgi:hypothetical protein
MRADTIALDRTQRSYPVPNAARGEPQRGGWATGLHTSNTSLLILIQKTNHVRLPARALAKLLVTLIAHAPTARIKQDINRHH